ncbi:MAG TPA: proton-conducting transporter membrane subunit, partial [Pirellulales bacterium]|nr:proton-conducting transporter membrane subunit [Pirellulales bacterium]
DLGGLAKRLPLLTTFMLIFTLSSIGLPGMNGFAGEFLVLTGMFQRAYVDAPPAWSPQWLAIAVTAVFGVVLGAWYMLWLVERVFFRTLKEPTQHDGHPVRDMSLREVLALAPLVVFIFWIGLAPGHFLRPMSVDLDKIVETVMHSKTFVDEYGEPGDHTRSYVRGAGFQGAIPSRSHAPRGNGTSAALPPRNFVPVSAKSRTRSVRGDVPTQSVGTRNSIGG